LQIPTFAVRRFNRLMVAHSRYVATISKDPVSGTATEIRLNILKTLQEQYSTYVEQGKNLIRRRHRIGEDSKPEKVDLGLALLEIARNVRDLHRAVRHTNDLTKALGIREGGAR
jgi:hypothetical protein